MKYKSIALLGLYCGLSFFGFSYISLGVLAYTFFTTVLSDKPLPRTEHQYFLISLVALIGIQVITFSPILAVMFGGFLFSYVSRNSTFVNNLRVLKKDMLKSKQKIKKKVKEYDID